MNQKARQTLPTWKRRVTSGFLAMAMSLPWIPAPWTYALEAEESWEEPSSMQVEVLAEETSTEEQVELVPEEVYSDQMVVPEEEGHWADPYIEKMVEYGYMREQDAVDPDAPMSRAEFSAVVNRAYNYTDSGPGISFSDVSTQDWFYDDIAIATTAGYISGTTPTTVEPHSTLTRETTAFILGKNMMLPELYGENTVFEDTREISDWSRSMVKATSAYGLMAGYSDGTFRPTNNITNGEIATLVTKAVGTPILQSGEISLGEVLGNVTITESGTVLKNTVIAGDLFISNGIGLGGVTLENVTVLGRIVVSGGESQDGEASILLRNVVANELVIDNMDNQYVSVRVDGTSLIPVTQVRTNAYVEDTTTTEMGLSEINIDAESGTLIDLAGRIKTVNNTSAGTNVRVTSGTVDVMNIDETAIEVVTEIMMGAEVIQLNIDVATDVVGEGDIENLKVNASDVVVEMLPDNIEIRPGVEANIGGETMDHLTADQFSAEPRILSGYPIAYDVAPTTLDAIFATNKVGTVYWGISYISQGSISADDLLSPPSYGNLILQYGSIAITEADEEFTAPISELYVGGEYYLSAVLVDDKGDQSPVKIISFTTPDDSVPAFVEPTPYMSEVNNTSAQVTVMASKDCKLYYAVMSAGAVAPTSADFIANSLSGNWGTGTQTLEKNKSYAFMVSLSLAELTEYDLYLWLTDADNMHYSEVVKLDFKTSDGTPPVFNQSLQTTLVGLSDVSFNFNMNEDGYVYWVIVESGTNYPVPLPPNLEGVLSEPLNSDYAPYAVMWGVAATTKGEVAAIANSTIEFNIAGLELETAYDLYYVGRDLAENFTESVYKLSFNTIDNTAPTFVEQLFSHTANSESDTTSKPEPYSTTDITLVFSEGIQSRTSGTSFLQLYNNILNATDAETIVAAKNALASAMEECFTFYIYTSGYPTEATVRNAENEYEIGEDWVIDYRNVEITVVDKQMHVTFPTIVDTNGSRSNSALNLSTGVTYGFKLTNIRDSSSDANSMQPAELTLDTFTTVYAEVMLGTADIMVGNLPFVRDVDGTQKNDYDTATVDADLQMTPSDMSTVSDDIVFELRMNPETEIAYNLYMRVVDKSGKSINSYDIGSSAYTALMEEYPETPNLRYTTEYKADPDGTAYDARLTKVKNNFTPDDNGWIYLNRDDVADTANPNATTRPATIQGNGGGNGVGLFGYFLGYQSSTMAYPFLNDLSEEYRYQFVFEVIYYNGTTDASQWNGMTTIDMRVYAGNYSNISSVGAHGSPLEATLALLSLISSPTDYKSSIIFNETSFPYFGAGAPVVESADITAELGVSLNRDGTVYYAIVKSNNPNNLTPRDEDGNSIIANQVPDISLENFDSTNPDNWPINPDGTNDWLSLTSPIYGTIVNNKDTTVISGSAEVSTGSVSIPVEDLEPLTTYYVYLVTESVNGSGYSEVYMGKFTTKETEKPKYPTINSDPSSGNVTWTTHVGANLDYLMLTTSEVSGSTALNWVYESFYDYLLKLEDELSSVVKSTNADGTFEYYTFIELYEGSTYWKNNDSKYHGTENQDECYTILDLLVEGYTTTGHNPLHPDYSNGYTAFDVYASDTMKKKLYDAISGYTNNIVAQGSTTVEANESSVAERNTDTGNDPDFEYIFFVTGSNVNADTVSKPVAETHTFRSLANFAVTDLNGPKLDTVNTTSAKYDPVDKSYSGSFLIEFDKYVYAALGNTTYFIQRHENPPTIEPWDTNNRVVEMNDITRYSPNSGVGDKGDISLYLSSGADNNTVAKGFTFNFTNITNSSTVTLFDSTYFLSNKNGVQHAGTNTNTLILTFNVVEETTTETETKTEGNLLTTTTTTTTTREVWWSTNWDGTDAPSNNVVTLAPEVVVASKTEVIPDTTTPDTGTGASAVSAITLSDTAVASLLLGDTDTIEATLVGGTGKETVTWSVENTSCMSVSKSGNKATVTALLPGTYKLTAKYDNLSASCTVTIPKPEVTVTGSTEGTTNAAETLTVTVTGVYDLSKLNLKTISWVSPSDISLGTVTNTFAASSNPTTTLKQSTLGGDCIGTISYLSKVGGSGKIEANFMNILDSIQVSIPSNTAGG